MSKNCLHVLVRQFVGSDCYRHTCCKYSLDFSMLACDLEAPLLVKEVHTVTSYLKRKKRMLSGTSVEKPH